MYLDLHEALGPLFPPNHLTLMTLSAPPSPTSSPLLSTVNLLKETLIALRERSAPIRDEQIDTLLSTISFPPTTVQHTTTSHLEDSPPETPELQILPLAEFVIDNIKAVLSLGEKMKSDLNNFIIGSMTEEQLMDVLSTEVESREREFVLNHWGDEEHLRDLWLSWSKEISPQDKLSEHRWTDKLFKALESDKPVFCVPPTFMSATQNDTTQPMTNTLPPQLFFVIPALVNLQNYIQAAIITAALHILARPAYSTIKPSIVPPSFNSASNDVDLRHDFVQHIWTLLRADIDTDSIDHPSFDGRPATTSNNIPETKLINLADEVVLARRKFNSGSPDSDEETRLRAAVDRTLKTSDPVFLLLKKRLFDSLKDKLNTVGRIQDARYSTKPAVPERMQTGRVPQTELQKKVVGISATRGSSSLNSHLEGAITGVRFEVLGFEHAVLRNALAEAYKKLVRCIFWTERVWGNGLN